MKPEKKRSGRVAPGDLVPDEDHEDPDGNEGICLGFIVEGRYVVVISMIISQVGAGNTPTGSALS